MRKYTELNLVNLANNLIGKFNITYHFLAEGGEIPEGFFNRATLTIGDEMREISPATLGCIASFLLGCGECSDYRSVSSSKLRTTPFDPSRLGGDTVRVIATVVAVGAMYEILASERLFRLGRNAGVDYCPTPKLYEFVKTVRLQRSADRDGLEWLGRKLS